MPAWREGCFELPFFALERGGMIEPFRLSYAILGMPSASGDNVVLYLPTASGVKGAAAALVGKDALFDPEVHAVIAVDAIGGGLSSRPSDGRGPAFPVYTIRDNARAVGRLLTEALAFRHIKAAGGASMGAMIALELAICRPGLVGRLYLWSPSSRCSATFAALARLFETALTLDPAFRKGRYVEQPRKGLELAGQAYFLSLVGRRYLDSLAPSQAEALGRSIGHAFATQWDANDLLGRYRCLLSHDVTQRGDGSAARTLQSLDMPCLLMPCPSDLLLPIEDVEAMHRALPVSELVPIDSELGHWSASQPPGSLEYRFVTSVTRAFLDRLHVPDHA